MGQFFETGVIVPSNTGRSFRVYALTDNGQRVFIGLVSRKSLAALLRNEIGQADISKFAETAAGASYEPLSFSLELKP